jgi:hypothetical protein
MGFETREVIEQYRFLEAADELLGQAESASGDIYEAREAANNVSEKLDAVESGALEVEPPLSGEQFTGYRERSSTVLRLANKAIAAVEAAKQTASSSRPKTKREGRSFKGRGSSSKG